MKIDVHWHYLPHEYVDRIRRGEGSPRDQIVAGEQGAEWLHTPSQTYPLTPELYQPEAQVRELDRRGLDLAAVSVAPTLFNYNGDVKQTLALHRMANDSIADMMAAYPGRFAGLATVPLQAPSLAIAELERAMLVKGLRGVEIGSNVGGRNLDEDDFLVFFQRCAQLGAFIFVHPTAVLGIERLRRYYLNNIFGNPSDTAVAVASLIFGGVYDAAPGLTCCFAHGGGTFPLLIGRWDHGFQERAECKVRISRRPREYLSQVYVDSLVHDDRLRRYIIDTVGADHMLVGSDLPYDMGDSEPVQTIERMPGLDDRERQLILGDTAARLLKLDVR
jgi:aminocarboxymuconate-semialdehyde decarboxylase